MTSQSWTSRFGVMAVVVTSSLLIVVSGVFIRTASASAVKTHSNGSDRERLIDFLERLIDDKTEQSRRSVANKKHHSKVTHHRNPLFNAHVKDDPKNPCEGGADVSGTSGVIQSPGYDQGSYPNQAQCGWRLTAPAGKVISVTFESFKLQDDEKCKCERDFVELFDGLIGPSSSLCKFCGRKLPPSVTSSGEVMFIVFRTDGGVNEGQFSLTWKATAPTSPPARNSCSPVGLIDLSQHTGSISMPFLDPSASSYPDGALCRWRITAPSGQVVRITFNNFGVELSENCDLDSVSIFDGSDSESPLIGKYCGPRLPQELILSRGSVVLVQFSSDEADSGVGFNLTWNTVVNASSQEPPVVSDPTCGLPVVPPAVPAQTNRIVGGQEAIKNSWPWQCSIRYKFTSPPWNQWCGAVVISANTAVLSAAHCAFDSNKNRIGETSLKVICGDHNQSAPYDPNRQMFSVSRIIVHEFYHPSSSNFDIAVFILKSSLSFSSAVLPACLPRNPVAAGHPCVVTGWGDTRGTGDAGVLRQVIVPVITSATCSQGSYYGGTFTDNMLCAGYAQGMMDSCTGDSGGPLVCPVGNRWFLQGIVSFGSDCARPRKPGVYTRVLRFLPWIADKTGVTP